MIKHPWFKGFPWDKLKEKILEAPYKPEVLKNILNDHLLNKNIMYINLDYKWLVQYK